MIKSKIVFPVKIASTYAPAGLLTETFDEEIHQIVSPISKNLNLPSATGENISTIRVMPDIMTLPSVKKFSSWIKKVIPQLWEEIGYEPAELAVERSWVNQFKQGSILKAHGHGSTEMVMTYYHKIPAGSSSITFYNPFEVSTGMAPFSEKSFTIQPEEGLLLAWPGFLWHQVNENKVDDTRIAISMHVHQGSFTLADRWRLCNPPKSSASV
jgi:hypothetical protein